MNLRKFFHLLAVIESGSFRKAAEEVHLSQPALTRSLASLEEELGVTLLDRSYGRVVPTSYAQPIVDHIRRISSESRALKESVRRIKGLEEGEIRIGFGPFAAATALCPVMNGVVSRHPRLRVGVEIANSGLLLELLQQDRLDIVVGDSRYLEKPDGVQVMELQQQEIAIVIHRDHRLAEHDEPLSLQALRHHTSGAPTLPIELQRAFLAQGLPDFPTVTCDDMRVLIEMAEAGSLVVLVPRLVVRELTNHDVLRVLPLPMPISRYTKPCIMYARGRTLGPAGTLLVRLISDWFGMRSYGASAEDTGASPD
ncbi:MAG: LysR family transcriptional regulator [Comamonas sp.]|nr:LysR family transcriptional regulator [Comamonas sp.]